MKQDAYTTLKHMMPILESAQPQGKFDAVQHIDAALQKLSSYIKVVSAEEIVIKPIYFESMLSEEQLDTPTSVWKYDLKVLDEAAEHDTFDIVEMFENEIQPDESERIGFRDDRFWDEISVLDGEVAVVFNEQDETLVTLYILKDTEDVQPILDDPAPIVESAQPIKELKQLQAGKVLVDNVTKARYDIETVDMSDPEAYVLEVVKQATSRDAGGKGLMSTKTIKANDLRSTRLYIE